MKLTTLDVLIVTALASENTPVVLPQATVNTHSKFVKESPLFGFQFSESKVFIHIREPRLFKQKIRYWRSMYKQDHLLPFAVSGYGALRLSTNANLMASTLFDNREIYWDLQQDTCYIKGKAQVGTGLQWAWDWFAVHQIVVRGITNVNIYNEGAMPFSFDFVPELKVKEIPHKVSLKFTVLPYSTTGTRLYNDLRQGQYLLFCALDAHRKFPAIYPPLQMVERSTKATFDGHVVDLHRMNGYSQKMLWLGAKQQGRHVPFAQAFREIYGRKKGYKLQCSYGRNVQLTPDKKIQVLKDARRLVKDKLETVIDTNKLPYTISIYAGKKGFQLIIDEKPKKKRSKT